MYNTTIPLPDPAQEQDAVATALLLGDRYGYDALTILRRLHMLEGRLSPVLQRAGFLVLRFIELREKYLKDRAEIA